MNNNLIILIIVVIIIIFYVMKKYKKIDIEHFFYFDTPKPINDIIPPTDYTHFMGPIMSDSKGYPVKTTNVNIHQAREILNRLKKKLPPGVKETDYFYGPLELRGGNNPAGIDELRQKAIALYVQHQKYISYYR